VAWLALWAVAGLRRGAAQQVLSLASLVAGAIIGSRVAPLFLPDGERSPWVPLAGLVGALVGSVIVSGLVLRLAAPLRPVLARGPLRGVDMGAGLLVGGAIGLALAWLVAALAILQPGSAARERIQESAILRRLVEALPPDAVLGALYRADPRPLLPGLPLGLPEPDESVLRTPGAREARAAVVRIQGRSCGLPVQGSGWIARRDVVVTNAHVIAGERSPQVLTPGGRRLRGVPVHVDAANDLALLRVEGLDAAALRIAPPPDTRLGVVLMGYPLGGPLTAAAGSAGPPRTVIAPNAYGRRPRPRAIVPLRGALAPGNSGGPAVDAQGRVVATIFAATRDGRMGAGVPPGVVADALRGPLVQRDPGPCVR
jgi:S1-C subfamily serine protease